MRRDPTPRPLEMDTPLRAAMRHVALPLLVLGSLIGAYFSGIEWMGQVVAPVPNREFGALETLQHLLLLAFAVLVARLAWRASRRGERVLFGVVALGAVFVLLEELDYGLHFYEALAGVPPEERARIRNLHNIRRGSGDELADAIKRGADVVIALYFVAFPLLASRIRNERVRALVPSRWLIATLAVAFVASRVAHALDDAGAPSNGSLAKALGEFRELGTYYAWFLYAASLWRCQREGDAQRGRIQGG